MEFDSGDCSGGGGAVRGFELGEMVYGDLNNLSQFHITCTCIAA